MYIFILEDDANRMVRFKRKLIGNRIDHAETIDIGREMVRDNKYDLIFLDHDLGGKQMVDSTNEDTGYHLALFIANNDKNKDTPCIVHSCNPGGADNMATILPHAIKVPFPSLDIEAAVVWAQEENK